MLPASFTISTSTLAGGLIVLWCLRWWYKRGVLKARREQAKQETNVLSLLVDHVRFVGQSRESLERMFGNHFPEAGLDFGQTVVEWRIGTLRIVAWLREGVCESISVERLIE